MHKLRTLLLLTLAAPGLASPALATDGVLEINQACAVQTGCFAGDTPGYPVTISSYGSYRLTSNLTGLGANNNGIYLTASRVTIDFNGFMLSGPSVGSGTGHGITGSGISGKQTTIKNGAIRGMRGTGVNFLNAQGVRVENMVFDFNLSGAIHVGKQAQLLRNRITDNGGTYTDSVYAGTGSAISENVVSGSGGWGIHCTGACTVSGNTVSGTADNGIVAATGSTVSGNTVYGNGGFGIEAKTGSTISGNTVHSNTGYGLSLAADASYRANTIVGNTAGAVVGGFNAGGNYCVGTGVTLPSCP